MPLSWIALISSNTACWSFSTLSGEQPKLTENVYCCRGRRLMFPIGAHAVDAAHVFAQDFAQADAQDFAERLACRFRRRATSVRRRGR